MQNLRGQFVRNQKNKANSNIRNLCNLQKAVRAWDPRNADSQFAVHSSSRLNVSFSLRRVPPTPVSRISSLLNLPAFVLALLYSGLRSRVSPHEFAAPRYHLQNTFSGISACSRNAPVSFSNSSLSPISLARSFSAARGSEKRGGEGARQSKRTGRTSPLLPTGIVRNIKRK